MISIGKKTSSHHPDDPSRDGDYQKKTYVGRLLEVFFDVDRLD